jgi:hypothetical protein
MGRLTDNSIITAIENANLNITMVTNTFYDLKALGGTTGTYYSLDYSSLINVPHDFLLITIRFKDNVAGSRLRLRNEAMDEGSQTFAILVANQEQQHFIMLHVDGDSKLRWYVDGATPGNFTTLGFYIWGYVS